MRRASGVKCGNKLKPPPVAKSGPRRPAEPRSRAPRAVRRGARGPSALGRHRSKASAARSASGTDASGVTRYLRLGLNVGHVRVRAHSCAFACGTRVRHAWVAVRDRGRGGQRVECTGRVREPPEGSEAGARGCTPPPRILRIECYSHHSLAPHATACISTSRARISPSATSAGVKGTKARSTLPPRRVQARSKPVSHNSHNTVSNKNKVLPKVRPTSKTSKP